MNHHGSRRALWRWLVMCAAGTVQLTSQRVQAQPVALVYAAPRECPSAPAVLERVALLVRRQPPVPTAAKATISRQGRSYLLELRVDGGSRHIVSESCDSLVQTLAVILSLAVEPRNHSAARDEEPQLLEPSIAEVGKSPDPFALGALAEGAERPKPSATGTAAPKVDPGRLVTAGETPKQGASLSPLGVLGAPVTATDRPKKPEAAAVSVASRAVATARLPPQLVLRPALLLWTEYGMMPHLAHGPLVGVWFDLRDWALAVTAVWLVPQWAPMPYGDARRGGYLSFLGGQASGCAIVVGPQMVGLCGGVEVGDMMGKGSGVSNTKLGHGVWLAGTAEVVIRPRFWSKMSAELRIGLALPIKRPAFGIDGYSWRFEPHGWSMRLASGFSWF